MNKRVFRDIKSNFTRYLALFVLTIIAVGMYVGFILGTNSAKDVYEDYLKDNRLEDGYFTLDSKLEKNIKSDVEDEDVTVYDNFYVDANVDDDSTLRVFKDRKECNLPYVKTGNLPKSNNEIFLDQLYAKSKKLDVTDNIELNGKKYNICGIGAFPDYTISLETPSQMLADRSKFGVAMVADNDFKNFDDKDIVYNYAYTYNKDNLSDSEKKEKLRTIVKTLACVSLIQNYGKLDEAFEKMSNASEIKAYSETSSNKRISGVVPKMESNKSMATMFVGVIVIIIAFLYVIFTKQTIQKECSILGTLMALGIKKAKILISYIIAPCLVTFIASVVGVILGAKVLYVLPINSLVGYYSIPECTLKIDTSVFLVAMFLPVIMIAIINIISILKNLHRKPLQLIRHDLKKNKGAKKSHLNIGSFEFRFKIRMFTRSIGVYFLLFIGIFLGGFLMMFGVGMSSSFDAYIDNQESDAVCKYQYGVLDEYKADGGEEATLGGFDYTSKKDKQTYSLSGIGVKDNSKYFKDISDISYGEIVITDATAKKFDLAKDDTIKLENSSTGNENEYKIIDIVDYNLGLSFFTNQDEMNNILMKGSDYHNYYFSDKELDIPDEKIVSKTNVDDYVANGKVMKDAMKSMIIMFPVIAVIIYLIIMYILIKLVISQNEIGISMLKVFGFTEKEIRKMYINTNTIVTILTVLITLPLQNSFMVAIWPSCIKTVPGFVDFVMKKESLAIIAIVGIVCYFIANFTSLRRVKKVPMVMALKNQDV